MNISASDFPRFSKTRCRYAPQIVWQLGEHKIPLHPLAYESPMLLQIDEATTPIVWPHIFSLFTFASLKDLVFWVFRAREHNCSEMSSEDFFAAAGYVLDSHLVEDFLFLHALSEKLSPATNDLIFRFCDEKNLPMRLLVQFLRRVGVDSQKKYNDIEIFFTRLKDFFLTDYIKNNSLREIFKIMNDLSWQQNSTLLDIFADLQKNTHFDRRKSLNSLYFQAALQLRYPMLSDFKNEMAKLTRPLEKQNKAVKFEFHPSFEKSWFQLVCTIQKETDIKTCKDFFSSSQNQETLKTIRAKLLEG